MKHEKVLKRIGYITLGGLLALIAFCYWGLSSMERSRTAPFLSDGAVSVVVTICVLVFYAAVAIAGFIVVRAFYIELTQSESEKENEREG